MLLRLLRYLPIYVACIGLAGLFWQRPLVLTILYIAVSVVVLTRYRSRGDLIYYFVPFFMGPLGELLPVGLGAWTYAEPLVMIPLWLPFVWGLAGLFMRRTSAVIEEHFAPGAARGTS